MFSKLVMHLILLHKQEAMRHARYVLVHRPYPPTQRQLGSGVWEVTLAFLDICSNVFSFVICICLGGSPRGVGTAQSTYDPPFQRPALPDTATGATWATLERSGSLRNDIQKENLKNGRFWSLQPGSGRAPAAARARFSLFAGMSLGDHFGHFLDPIFSKSTPILGTSWGPNPPTPSGVTRRGVWSSILSPIWAGI